MKRLLKLLWLMTAVAVCLPGFGRAAGPVLLFSEDFESGNLSSFDGGCPNANTITNAAVHGGPRP